MPPKSSSKKDVDVSMPSPSQSQPQRRSQSQSQGRRQQSYHGARSISFGEVQDPMLWMTRTPVPAATMDGRPPFLFASRQLHRTSSPYPTNIPAARGYLPSYQLPGTRHQNTRSPPIPLYRRFPTPRFTGNGGHIPPLRSDQSRPYSATNYRTQHVDGGDGEDEVILPPRPATTSDADLVVPPRPAVFPARRRAQGSSKVQGNIKGEMGSQVSRTGTTPEMLARPTQQPNSQKQPRIILKNYKRASKPLDEIQESAVAQESQMKPKVSPFFHPAKKDTMHLAETKQEEKLEYGDDDSTVTGSSSSSSNSDDELALDLARDPPYASQHNARPTTTTTTTTSTGNQECSTPPSTAGKDPTPWKTTIHETSKAQDVHGCAAAAATTTADTPPQEEEEEEEQRLSRTDDASTQSSARHPTSRGTQTTTAAPPPSAPAPPPKRQKKKEKKNAAPSLSSAETIASALEEADSVLRDAVAVGLDELVAAARDDVGALVRDRLARAGDARVLRELELAMLVRMAVDDEALYAQVESMLA
ncbi:hypothetical protein F4809DRAFT_33264 [Biscogniauxia mediterranea]|nr:hypothetical protein F4809DRAFT_33264 [Biscogniauxia mediterranea]